MTNLYKINLTQKAYGDLKDIYRYIKEELHNKNSALKVIDEIENRILLLKDYPKTGVFVKDEVLVKRGYRKLLVNNYIALYLIDEDRKVVNIIRVVYGKRDYLELV
ncbi:type II toxin-antitoxin system RelE/ParE family toxin [Thiospirochaeta perfilievii]|uniref:type II toxin-antitoxin system RelE/ParE family toxin n=1 Tax=Thiospirochaeta perfilievii TaxID=252967 RepID=UPI0016590D25|nr:type II toxin-antitoxin system RelE/ParE family toxin [Thiospirochaeta perfilievii]